MSRIRVRKSELVSEHEKLQEQRRQWNDVVKGMHDYILKVSFYSTRVVGNGKVSFHFFLIRSSVTTLACGSFRWTTTGRCTSSLGRRTEETTEAAAPMGSEEQEWRQR